MPEVLNGDEELRRPTSYTGRLHRLLQDAVARDGNRPFLDVWAELLGVDPANRSLVYVQLGAVYGLLENSKAEIRSRAELKQSLYLETVEGIERIMLSANHQSPWQMVSGQLAGSNLRSLEFCGDQLDRLSLESEVPPELLRSLSERVEALLHELTDSNLESELKLTLLAKLEDVRGAIFAYRVRGLDGIRIATQAAVGAMVMEVPRAESGVSKLKVVQDVLDVLSKLANLVEKAGPLRIGAVNLVKALLGNGGGGSGV